MTLNKRISWADLKKQRRSIGFAAIAVLVLLVVHVFWLMPVLAQKQDTETRIAQQKELIAKYEEKLKQAQSIREKLEKQETELKQMQQRLFQGNDPYQLAASLSDKLSKGEDKEKLDIKTYQVLASKEYGLYQEVHLRFNIMTTIEGLYYFLDQVRNFQTAILVQEINIQKIQRNSGPDLVINVILAALMEKGEKS